MIVDTHHHLWSLANSYTDWPTRELSTIYRDFSVHDFAPIAHAAGISSAVLVQAAPSFVETLDLLAIAEQSDLIGGVVGWIDFESSQASSQIEEFANHPKAVGVRPMLQSIAERGWVLRADFHDVFGRITDANLAFDALVKADQIPQIAKLAARHPELRIVLDHAGKPNIADNDTSDWERYLSELATNENVFCKLSGLLTEAGARTCDNAIGSYVSHMFEAFGSQRIMWGSDWPVLKLAGEYDEWLMQARRLTKQFGGNCWEDAFGEVARKFYQLQICAEQGGEAYVKRA